MENDTFSLDVHESFSFSINSDWDQPPLTLALSNSYCGMFVPLEGVKFAPLSGRTVEGVCKESTALLSLLAATRSTDGWFAITDTASRTQRNERVLSFLRGLIPKEKKWKHVNTAFREIFMVSSIDTCIEPTGIRSLLFSCISCLGQKPGFEIKETTPSQNSDQRKRMLVLMAVFLFKVKRWVPVGRCLRSALRIQGKKLDPR